MACACKNKTSGAATSGAVLPQEINQEVSITQVNNMSSVAARATRAMRQRSVRQVGKKK